MLQLCHNLCHTCFYRIVLLNNQINVTKCYILLQNNFLPHLDFILSRHLCGRIETGLFGNHPFEGSCGAIEIKLCLIYVNICQSEKSSILGWKHRMCPPQIFAILYLKSNNYCSTGRILMKLSGNVPCDIQKHIIIISWLYFPLLYFIQC